MDPSGVACVWKLEQYSHDICYWLIFKTINKQSAKNNPL